LFESVSALAPIAAPSQVPWGMKAFLHFFGTDRSTWAEHDAVSLLASGKRFASKPLVDQGSVDKFLADQLRPELLGSHVALRMHDGYDHSYFFVQSMIEDQLRHHARVLR
jgi:S-formylglutathione hydrolase